jgi:HK97 gp10 family phage protein
MATRVALTPSGSRIKAYLEGGPELKAALAKLERGLADELLATATLEGAEIIAAEWKARAPVGSPPEKVPGAYRDSINAKSKPGKKGATAIIAVGRYPGLPAGQQPRRYAPKLEFGSSGRTRMRTGSGASAQPAQPSARPAFDAAQGRAIDAVERRLKELVTKATP